MKVLFISNLFPDATEPTRGIHNARLLGHLAKLCDIRVISPRPALPLFQGQPRQPRPEDHAFKPVFPNVWYVPKVGSRWNHRLMAHCLQGPVKALRHEFPFDVVLGSWIYPDGCAVARLAAGLNFPFAVIAQGTDVHQYLRNPTRRRIIVAEMDRAGAIITRSGELARLLREAGIPAEKLKPIYNGVDFDVFQPGDARKMRKELELPEDARIVLFVGNFVPVKNPLLLVNAFIESRTRSASQNSRLVMVGDGPLLGAARERAGTGGLGGSISFVGRKSPAEVARFMRAADVLCVPSDNEGVPNVILEAFATGLRVVATRTGGIPEVVCHDFLGRLVEPSNPGALAAALAQTLGEQSDAGRIVDCARHFSWAQTARQYLDVLQTTLSSRR